jgi:hypothetical protein
MINPDRLPHCDLYISDKLLAGLDRRDLGRIRDAVEEYLRVNGEKHHIRFAADLPEFDRLYLRDRLHPRLLSGQ